MMILLLIALLAAFRAEAQAQDDLIVPGVRVGPVRQSSTIASLRALPGVESRQDRIQIGEGETEPGLILYPNDPSRRLDVVWRGSPATVASVWICPSAQSACRWRTAAGVGRGTAAKELERLNGKPFELMGCCFDYGGSVVSYRGGKLASFESALRLFLDLSPAGLSPRQANTISGEKVIRSDLPLVQRLNPKVSLMRLDFPERP